MRSELRRLRTIAKRRGLCPIHLTTLVCLRCEARQMGYVWRGTDAEHQELLSLSERVAPYLDQRLPAGVCPLFGCGGRLYCEPCYHAVAARQRVPEDLYTDEELARCHELLGLLRVTDGTPPRPSIPRQERNP